VGSVLSDAACRLKAFGPAGALGPEPEGRARLAAAVGAAARVLLDSNAAWTASDRAAAGWCLRAVALHADGAAAIRADPAAAAAVARWTAGGPAASARCGPGRRQRSAAPSTAAAKAPRRRPPRPRRRRLGVFAPLRGALVPLRALPSLRFLALIRLEPLVRDPPYPRRRISCLLPNL
jgi:hypothetical protein